MANLKSALCSLAPVAYEELPSDDALPKFLKDAFAHAELLVNSIPIPAASSAESSTLKPANSAHNAEDTYCDPTGVPIPEYERDSDIVKAWGKPYKMSAKDNPLAVQVYKMAAHDRHGAWFCRRSVHQGIGFQKWKKAASREFLESLKVQEGPGSGAVRGVGADRRVEKLEGPHESAIEVWQTSSAFPGPVTPRESLTLLLSSSNALSEKSAAGSSTEGQVSSNGRIPRHWLVISRPTKHPDAPNRPNLVKMEYESVEMIREVPVEGNADPESNPIEWLMVTRSDPGGGIPRFMVERGTPNSIVGDVNKFLNWATGKSEEDFDREEQEQDLDALVEQKSTQADEAPREQFPEEQSTTDDSQQLAATAASKASASDPGLTGQQHDGLVSRFTEAVESTVSGYLPVFQQQTGAYSNGQHDGDDSSSDISDSSDSTFRSALHEQRKSALVGEQGSQVWDDSSVSLSKSITTGNRHSRDTSKELEKLQQKRAVLDEKARKERDAFAQKATHSTEKEEKERNKMLDKHGKERKKQEERYQRELAKLDQRRIKEERKEESRRKKAEEKDATKKLKQEVSEWKSKCEVAEKESELLTKQVENLQRENTAMVARLGEDEVKSILSGKGKSKPSSSKAESIKSGKSGTS